MKSNYDFLTEALKNLDEKYIAETAECLSVPKNSSGRNITIDSEDLIEIKNGIRKSNCVSAIIAVAAVFVCVIVTSMFLIMNDNRVQALGSTPSDGFSDYSENNQSTQSKNENPSPDASNNDLSELSNTVIQNMTKIDENTLLAIGQDNLVLADTNTCKIIKKIPRTNGMYVQKFDGGFITIDTRHESCSYNVYDNKGEKIKHVNIPMKKSDSDNPEFSVHKEIPTIELTTFRISSDGEKVVYYGDNGLCTNSVELDNETVIQGTDEISEGFDKFYQMTKCLLYIDEIIYGEAVKYNSETDENEQFFASMNLKTKEWKYYQSLDDGPWIGIKNDFVDNSFLITGGYGDYSTEGMLLYMTLGDATLKEFMCEENYEGVIAFISDNANFLLTTHEHSINDAEIKLYDVKTGEVLLKQKTDYHAQTAYIDENERKLYVVCGTEFSVFDF